ncbi:hypothetical protein B7463_g12288, partial [Scytalidium lignicola]
MPLKSDLRKPYTVKVQSGEIEGFISPEAPRTAQFLGIPYALPPIGPRRWAPPVPKDIDSYISTKEFSDSCMQSDLKIPTVWNTDVVELSSPGPRSEDCLTLNIWMPIRLTIDSHISTGNGNRSKLPVIVWIHGGGFIGGGGDVPYQNPYRWVERSQRHLVVGINYRLNIFGFPCAAGIKSAEQNLGLLDQQLALEWIRNNISAFGGDLSRVTLWGQSAGAMAADYHNFFYSKDPPFHGIILNSGTTLLPLSHPRKYPTGHQNFSFVAKNFGCSTTDPEAELEYMRDIKAEEISKFLGDHWNKGVEPRLAFIPVIDNKFVFADQLSRGLSGKFSKVPAIIGTTAHEGDSIVPWHPDAIDTMMSDRVTKKFLQSAEETTKYRLANNAPTFRFLYTGIFPNVCPRPWLRAYHSAEIPIIFGTSMISREPDTELENETSRIFQDMYLVFAEDPVNGLGSNTWKPYGPDGVGSIFGSPESVMKVLAAEEFDQICHKMGSSEESLKL